MIKTGSLLDEICFRVTPDNLQIRADQVRARLSMFPVMVGSQLILEPLTAALLWRQTSHAGLLIWLATLLLLHSSEIWSWYKHRTAVNTVQECQVWSVRFTVLAGMVGSMWGIAAICFFPADFAYQALFLGVILGLAAGAVTMNPVYPPALYLFLACTLLPTIFRVAFEGDTVHAILAVMLALFAIVVLNSGRQLVKTFFTSLSQRYENLALVEQMTREKSRAESANREKSKFLAAASHDLRQPLQALMLFSDALLEQAQEKETKQLAGQIGKSVHALVEMFDELLDISRLEAGIVEARWQNFELQPLLDRLYVDLAPLAQNKHLGFDIPIGEWVAYSDPFLLERILRNLISNAIRYTDRGSVTLCCTPTEGRIHFTVTDTGIGIPEAALPHIFEEYYQVGNQHRDRRKGLGLGLAIVRRLEGLLGCQVEVRSEPGKGSEFGFYVDEGDAGKLAQPFVTTYFQYDLHGVVVALVEDDPDIRMLIAKLMADWGCRILEGEHAEDVMQKINMTGIHPELLLCDYRLPQGMTAIHVIKMMRELGGKPVPTLILTGDTGTEALQDIHASGAMLLHKPISPTRLRTMMYFALHGKI